MQSATFPVSAQHGQPIEDAPLPTLKLVELERLATVEALRRADTLDEAGKLLGTTRHGVTRRIKKFNLHWVRVAKHSPAATLDA